MNIQGLPNFLVQTDRVCDWVPILSTVNNLVDLFIKTVVLPRMQPSAIRANHYYSHLDKKTFTRCTLLLIPILGQIIIYLADLLYDNKPFALELVKRNGLNLQGVSERLRHDRDVVLAAIKENHLAIEYAGEEFDEDSEIMSAYQKGNPPLSNRQQVLAAIEKDPMAIGEVSEEFWDDKEVMLAAVKRNGNLFIYASDRLKDDEDILLAAVPTNARALGLASRRIQDSEDIMLKALGCSDARVLYSVSDRLKDSKEFMRKAIELDPFAIACASKRLRKDKELTLLAVKKDVRVIGSIAKKSSGLQSRPGSL